MLKRFWMTLLAMMLLMTTNAMAAATDFASALPTSLIPTGFWVLIGLVFGLVIAVAGVVIGIKMIRRAT